LLSLRLTDRHRLLFHIELAQTAVVIYVMCFE